MELAPQLVPVWITSIMAIVGVIYSISRNGRSSKEQDRKLKFDLMNDMKTIKDRLDDEDSGLRAIKKDTVGMKEHCIKTHSALQTTVNTHADEIARLRKKAEK